MTPRQGLLVLYTLHQKLKWIWWLVAKPHFLFTNRLTHWTSHISSHYNKVPALGVLKYCWRMSYMSCSKRWHPSHRQCPCWSLRPWHHRGTGCRSAAQIMLSCWLSNHPSDLPEWPAKFASAYWRSSRRTIMHSPGPHRETQKSPRPSDARVLPPVAMTRKSHQHRLMEFLFFFFWLLLFNTPSVPK